MFMYRLKFKTCRIKRNIIKDKLFKTKTQVLSQDKFGKVFPLVCMVTRQDCFCLLTHIYNTQCGNDMYKR